MEPAELVLAGLDGFAGADDWLDWADTRHKWAGTHQMNQEGGAPVDQ